jgi:hypothetical protein
MAKKSNDIGKNIEAVLVAKGPDGEYLYSKQQVRDFIVACVFELGLDVTPELQGSMVSFLSELSVPEDAPTETILEQVRLYFAANPLPTDLLAEMGQVTRSSTLDGAEIFATSAQEAQTLSLVAHTKIKTENVFKSNPWQGIVPRRGIRAAS